MLGRILGLDVGEKRIGIAISDPLGITAQGLETLQRKDDTQAVKAIADIIDTREVTAVVVGLPKNMNNSIGFKAKEVEAFVAKLQAVRDLPVHWVDERLTTVQATQVLLEADVSRKKRKGVVDKLAAVFILQTFLDRHDKH